MEKRIYKSNDFKTTSRTTGSVDEISVFPEGSQYVERDFIRRISIDASESAESVLPELPGYERRILVLDGEAVFVHGNEKSVSLKAFGGAAFDGDVQTKCFGKTKTYSLTTRKECSSKLEMIDVQNLAQRVTLPASEGNMHLSLGFYCAEGHVVVSANEKADMIRCGEQMVLELDETDSVDIALMGEGRCIYSEVMFDVSSLMPEQIPEERASIEDFKTAFKLMHSRNKWNRVKQKTAGSNVWYDEALQKKLKFIDKTYITLVIWLIVIFALLFLPAAGMDMKTVAAFMIVWSVFYILIGVPLIYVAILPKPIRAHIKQTGSLTPYERKLYEEEKSRDERLEKVMRKYEKPDEGGENHREKLKRLFK